MSWPPRVEPSTTYMEPSRAAGFSWKDGRAAGWRRGAAVGSAPRVARSAVSRGSLRRAARTGASVGGGVLGGFSLPGDVETPETEEQGAVEGGVFGEIKTGAAEREGGFEGLVLGSGFFAEAVEDHCGDDSGDGSVGTADPLARSASGFARDGACGVRWTGKAGRALALSQVSEARPGEAGCVGAVA